MSQAKHITGPYAFDSEEAVVYHLDSGMHLATMLGVSDFPCRDTDKDDELEAELFATGELFAAAPEILSALVGLYGLCVLGASPNAFANGVTDSTGTIDEGNVRASEYIDAARIALSKVRAS